MLIFLLISLALADYCTYTTYGWSQRVCSQNLTSVTCGVGWCPLLRVDVASMLLPQNQAWLLAFHQYAAASLNRARDTYMETILSNSGIDEALLLLGSSLEQACGNVSLWVLTPVLSPALDLLFQFNHGTIPRGANATPLSMACGDEFSPANTSLMADTFYYVNAPDIIALRDAATNLTISISTLKQVYSTQLFLTIFNIMEGVAIGLLLLKLIIMRSDKRLYSWLKQNAQSAPEPSPEQHDIDLDILNESDVESTTDEL
jgi:hypothetical protein